MKLPYHLTRPPQALRKATLDNIALVPASLLFHKAEYKAVANKLPIGSVLICQPRQNRQRRIVASVASYYEEHGHQVTTIPIEMLLTRQAVI